ncbi:MAG: hypothetical protein V1810_01270 [Candidatus Beckwithbacteria bacterium]
MSDLKLEFLTLCDFAMTSSEGKLSVIGMFDRMFVTETPSSFLRFFIVAILTGKPNTEVKISFNIQLPSRKEVKPKEMTIKISTGGKINIINDVPNFPLPEVGEYKLSLKSGGKNLGSTSFIVSKVSVQSNKKIVN